MTLRQAMSGVDASSREMEERNVALRADADRQRRLAGERADIIARLEREVEAQEARLRAEARGFEAATGALQAEVSAANARADSLQKLFDFAQAQIAAGSLTLSAEEVCAHVHTCTKGNRVNQTSTCLVLFLHCFHVWTRSLGEVGSSEF